MTSFSVPAWFRSAGMHSQKVGEFLEKFSSETASNPQNQSHFSCRDEDVAVFKHEAESLFHLLASKNQAANFTISSLLNRMLNIAAENESAALLSALIDLCRVPYHHEAERDNKSLSLWDSNSFQKYAVYNLLISKVPNQYEAPRFRECFDFLKKNCSQTVWDDVALNMIFLGDAEALRLLLKTGANPNGTTKPKDPKIGKTPFIVLAYELEKENTDFNADDGCFHTPPPTSMPLFETLFSFGPDLSVVPEKHAIHHLPLVKAWKANQAENLEMFEIAKRIRSVSHSTIEPNEQAITPPSLKTGKRRV